jgi:hypothetical protein
VSLAALGFSLAVTLDCLLKGWTTLWDGVAVWVSIVLFFALLVRAQKQCVVDD